MWQCFVNVAGTLPIATKSCKRFAGFCGEGYPCNNIAVSLQQDFLFVRDVFRCYIYPIYILYKISSFHNK